MKIPIVLLAVMFLLCPAAVRADDFVYTGLTAEKIDPIGWYPGGTGAMGGPAANERLGLAQQFSIFAPTHMTQLDVTALIFPNIGSTTFTYNLYNQSTYNYFGQVHTEPIPLYTSLVLTSAPLTYTTTQADDNAGNYRTSEQRVDFDYTFQPGQYWIATEGGGGTYVQVQQTYIDPPIGGGGSNTAQTPEPEMIAPFLMFLAFVLWEGRKHVMGRLV